MTPKQFKEANLPLPAFRADNPQGEVITCWNLTFKERLRVLFKGEIWLSLLTFNKPLTPSFLTTDKAEVLTVNKH